MIHSWWISAHLFGTTLWNQYFVNSIPSLALYPCLHTAEFLKLWVNIDPTQLCHCCQTRMRSRSLPSQLVLKQTPGPPEPASILVALSYAVWQGLLPWKLRTSWTETLIRTRIESFPAFQGFTVIDIVLDDVAPEDLQTLLRFWTLKARRRQFLGARSGWAAACE